MRIKIDDNLFVDLSKINVWFITEYGIEYLMENVWCFISSDDGHKKWAKSLEKELRKLDENGDKLMTEYTDD